MCAAYTRTSVSRAVQMAVRVGTTAVRKRNTHQSASARYAKAWKQSGVDYREKMQFEKHRSLFHMNKVCAYKQTNMTDFPVLIRDVIRLETAMKMKGKVPFVHAQPHWMKIAQVLCNAFNGYPENFVYLRPLLKQYKVSPEKLMKYVHESFDRGENDWSVSLREHLVSCSYAFTGNLCVADSAAYHGFYLNGRDDAKEVGENAMQLALKSFKPELCDIDIPSKKSFSPGSSA